MKREKIMGLLKNKKVVAGVLAVAVVAGLAIYSFRTPITDIPELPSYEDPEFVVTAEDEETPLSSPKVTTKTTQSTKTSKKNVTLKSASTRTYTNNLGTKTTKNSKTTKNGNTTVKTDTTVATTTTEKYSKKSKIKVVTSKVTTTVKTTTTVMPAATTTTAAKSTTSSSSKTTGNSGVSTISVRSIAPLMDSRVLNAFENLGFKVIIDPSVSYAGYFDAKSRTITMRKNDSTIYHELGHFIDFMAGNITSAGNSANFASIYAAEKGKFPGANVVYASQSAYEYFAESMRVYIQQKADLKKNCPKTASTIETAISKITDTQVATYKKIYAAYWK
jgi:hypothetical protein